MKNMQKKIGDKLRKNVAAVLIFGGFLEFFKSNFSIAKTTV
jgi:hypothetical protein